MRTKLVGIKSIAKCIIQIIQNDDSSFSGERRDATDSYIIP